MEYNGLTMIFARSVTQRKTTSGQAAIFIALQHLSGPINALHKASLELSTIDTSNQFQLKRAREEHDQAQAKLTAAVDQALNTWSNKRAQ